MARLSAIATTALGLDVRRERSEDPVSDDELAGVWGDERRAPVGAHRLGWLLRRIAWRTPMPGTEGAGVER